MTPSPKARLDALPSIVFWWRVLTVWWRSMVAWLRTTPPLGTAPPLRTPDAQLIDCPLVLIAGNMGDATHAASELSARGLHVFCPPLGPVSSCHDRACELFYALKGGRVDYGAAHSAAHGHQRFGTIGTAALHPEWSSDRPVLLLTHSQGGLAARALLRLLAAGGFEGHSTSASWVRGIVAISAPFNGAPLIDHPGFGGVPLPRLRPLDPAPATPSSPPRATRAPPAARTADCSAAAAPGGVVAALEYPAAPAPAAKRGNAALRALMPHAHFDVWRLDEKGVAMRLTPAAYMPHHFLLSPPAGPRARQPSPPTAASALREQEAQVRLTDATRRADWHADADAALPRPMPTPLCERTAKEGAAAASELEQPVGRRVVSVLITFGYVADILLGWCTLFRESVLDWRVDQWALRPKDLLPLLRWRHILQALHTVTYVYTRWRHILQAHACDAWDDRP